MLEAGFAKVEFTPSGRFPLAGYAHWSERLSDRVRDPLFARALALREDGRTAVLVAWDLLLVTQEMGALLRDRLAQTGAEVVAHATHTHSSLGGLWGSFLARRFMGAPRPWALPHVLDAAERAARAAIAGLAPAAPRAASALLPGLNGNRRDPAGPKDEELSVLRLVRESDEAIVLSYSAHPVIVGERDHRAASADFPGEACRLLERDVAFAMFVQGSLGGVDVLFPDDKSLSADRNLTMMAAPLASSALNLARQAPPPAGGSGGSSGGSSAGSPAGPSGASSGDRPLLAHASADLVLGPPDSRPAFDDEVWRGRLDLPLRALFNALVRSVPRTVPIQALRVGDFAVVGTPADLGVGVGLAIKAAARAAGIPVPVAASQTDGYVGYVHPREAYARVPPPGSCREMAVYENAMNFFGRGTADRILDAARAAIGGIARG
ncbi:MAG: hypothetical protein FJ087_11580 [Deltaproteobacteria bacterium]|nr:hypothetical protein [Deltaproteobacteria bacterium]